MTIEALPDEALLEVFDFCVKNIFVHKEWWTTLAHVCRRWRYIVFASPLRLNLGLYCTAKKPVREMLDIWPPLPIYIYEGKCSEEDAENIIAALEQNNRVCGIYIWFNDVSGSVSGRLARAMQKPFPQLTDLSLCSYSDETTLVVPGTFLGGSAPHLRSCEVDYLPFPALRSLLLSASHLVHLSLNNIPHSAYISPEAMVHCLFAVTNLEILKLRFRSPRSRPNRATRHPPPLIRTTLPALTYFDFCGVSEYLEDFISRVDAPLLDNFQIILFHQLTLDVSQLHQFIGRTETLDAFNHADVQLSTAGASIELSQETPNHYRPRISLSMQCYASDWQCSFLAQACRLLSPTLSTFETLSVCENKYESLTPGWVDDMENSQWLELVHPFTSVKNLRLCKVVAAHIVSALRQLTEERVADVLPALQNIYVKGLQLLGPTQEGIDQFVAARRLSNHPVTVKPWDGRK